jgi:hypothetical protein
MRPRLRSLRLAAAIAAIMIGSGCSSPPVLRLPPRTAWRVVTGPALPCRHWPGGGTNASIDHVVALGPADVWTVGTCVVAETTAGAVSHWDGQRWISATLPGGALGAPASGPASGTIFPDNLIAGSSDDDMWVAEGVAMGGQGANVAFHWDGGRWVNQSQGLPPGGGFAALAASAAAGTWALVTLPEEGIPHYSPNSSWLVHWDGRRWQRITLPPQFDTSFTPDALAVGPGDSVWLNGEISSGARTVPFAARYDGHGWSFDRLPAETSAAANVTRFIIAGTTAWAIVGDAPPADSNGTLVRLTGGSQSKLTIPSGNLLGITAAAGDRGGEIYLVRADQLGIEHIQRWDGHAWRDEKAPAPRHVYVYQGSECLPSGSAYGKPGAVQRGLLITSLAAAPGSSTVWATGFVGGGVPLYPDCAQPTTQPLVETTGPVPQQ